VSSRPDVSAMTRETVKYERAKLNFFGDGKNLVIRRLKHNVEDISRPAAKSLGKTRGKTRFVLRLSVGKQKQAFRHLNRRDLVFTVYFLPFVVCLIK
jgi:hypothetical protein